MSDWSLIPDIIKGFGFEYIGEPDMYWFAYELNNADNGYRVEAKFNHIIIYHLDSTGDIYNGDDQEPFQFHLTDPEDLRIILNTLIV